MSGTLVAGFCRKCGAQLSGKSKFCPKCGTPIQAPVAPTATRLVQPQLPSSQKISVVEASSYVRERLSKGSKGGPVVAELKNWGVPESNANSIVVGIEGEVRLQKKKLWRGAGVKLIGVGIFLFFVIGASQYAFFSAPSLQADAGLATFYGLVYLLLFIVMIAGAVYVVKSFK